MGGGSWHLVVLLALLAAAHHHTAAAPQPWACGEQRDYFARVSTICAPDSCNALQRNLGGHVLVLDTKSYGNKGCQGCNPDVPATCCTACKETDRCNAWVVCTNKDGCGSGCRAYAAQFKMPLAYDAKLPHAFWGNWGGCQGDKWPFGMCSLKVVPDTDRPPVTSTNAVDGWVSGIVPKTAPSDPRCPAGMSDRSCNACLGTRAPAKCIACIGAANRLGARDTCVTCASLMTPVAQDVCSACAASASLGVCGACMDADCTGADCLNARAKDRTKAPNLAAATKCFECQATTAATRAATPAAAAARAAECARCFEGWVVPMAHREACVSCVRNASTAPAATGCPSCYADGVSDRTRCFGCARRAGSVDAARGCGSCNAARDVNNTQQLLSACYDCAVSVQPVDAGYCSNLEPGTSLEAAMKFYGCLRSVRGPQAGAACWQCMRTGGPAVTACYSCMGKGVSDANALLCASCWTPSRMLATAAGGSAAEVCERCLLSKDAAKQDASVCIQ